VKIYFKNRREYTKIDIHPFINRDSCSFNENTSNKHSATAMAYRQSVESVFGCGVIAEKVLEMRERDLLKNLSARVSSCYDHFAPLPNERLGRAQRNASSVYSECGYSYAPKSLPEGEMYISTITRDIARDVKALSKDAFVAKYTTCEGMTLLNKLKVNRAFMLYNDYKC
jgi:hypothetical protein